MPLASPLPTSSPPVAPPKHLVGVMLYPDAPFPSLINDGQWLEALGFDQILLPDHSGDLRGRNGFWLDSFTVLAALAPVTSRVRLGTLVANPILRPPAMLAKQAVSLDHLTGGRFELGIGAGVFAWDHHAVGTEPWSARERAGRLTDYVAILDGALRGETPEFDHAGEWLWAREVATVPGSVQRPRLPLIVGGQSPTVLRVTARYGDVWNTIGPMGANKEEVLATTARQNRELDALATAAGRDPAAIRRSFALYGAWDPWESDVTFAEVFERFTAIGITDFVTNVPNAAQRPALERMALDLLPQLRNH